MSKLAQVVVGETASDKLKEAQFDSDESYPVSYTHLTLPTILLV